MGSVTLHETWGDSGFEADQAKLEEQVLECEKSIAEIENSEMSIEQFMDIVKNAKQVKKLSRSILNRFVDHIVIHQAVREQGRWRQTVDIFYNLVGSVNNSNVDMVEVPEISIDVKQGVVLEHVPYTLVA